MDATLTAGSEEERRRRAEMTAPGVASPNIFSIIPPSPLMWDDIEARDDLILPRCCDDTEGESDPILALRIPGDEDAVVVGAGGGGR
mmetsp:Transcript_9458/g.28439  ORF Transcript_9458/g.28439 Transcript_9458/m.28439 type:complete len:87 (-) Transcript_9458:85-345(-)